MSYVVNREMEGKLNQLFKNYLNNQSSDREVMILLEYFRIDEQEPMLRELIMQELQRSGASKISIDGVDERLDLAYENVKQYVGLSTPSVIKKIKLWPRVVAASAAVAVLVSGIYFFSYHMNLTEQFQSNESNIAPGKVGATLTLANGKKISLADARNGELANEAGVSISKTANGQVVYEIKEKSEDSDQINTLTTANGQTYVLTLPDKSKVWLNAGSSLTYSASLNQQGLRKVKLIGEAYFEIFKNKAHPFVVQTGKQEIEVLGTHFNVNNYRDEQGITTTLLEGSVKISSGGIQTIIRPGEQALNKNGFITINQIDPETVTDWINGDFYLDNVNFKVAMRKIARWYDLEVVYDASVPADIESTGYISRTNRLSTVLRLIEKSGQVHFKVEGRRLYVSR